MKKDDSCIGGVGHSFHPRYEGAPNQIIIDAISNGYNLIPELLAEPVVKKYICDICERCGKIIKRKE